MWCPRSRPSDPAALEWAFPLRTACCEGDEPPRSRASPSSARRRLLTTAQMVDLSHTSPKTSSDALTASIAPVIFSHSNARGVHPAVRNLPDSILRRIGRTKPSLSDGEGGKGWGYGKEEALEIAGGDAWIGVNFSPDFVSEWPNGSGRRANITFMAGACLLLVFSVDKSRSRGLHGSPRRQGAHRHRQRF